MGTGMGRCVGPTPQERGEEPAPHIRVEAGQTELRLQWGQKGDQCGLEAAWRRGTRRVERPWCGGQAGGGGGVAGDWWEGQLGAKARRLP